MKWQHIIRGVLLGATLLVLGCKSKDETQINRQVNVAVATNFYTTALKLETAFEQQTGLKVSVTSGSTGQLYAQIRNGAPYHIFLAADQVRPQKLTAEKFAQDRFTYALGRLVLWGQNEDTPNIDMLTQADYRHLAIANPNLAPYGFAAQEIISGLDIPSKIVMGENIGQVFSIIETGNAEFGFVSLSQIIDRGNNLEGAYWVIPMQLYTPIIQDAVLLSKESKNAAAKEFYQFLKSETARDIIKAAGYNISDGI